MLLSGCISTPVIHNTSDICKILDERKHWHKAINASAKKYQVPAHLLLAIISQESSFYADARPPRQKLFGIVPWSRPSSAYGFPQAIDSTWRLYQKKTGNYNANRDNFADSADFVGWYVTQSLRLSGIAKTDAYRQYLAYHEGQTGFNKQSYLSKKWLIKTAKVVQQKAKRYQQQLKKCPFVPDKGFWHRFF